MKIQFAFILLAFLCFASCDKDDGVVEPTVDDDLGLFDAKFENDFALLYYDGTARYSMSTNDGQQSFSLMLQDSNEVRHFITTDVTFSSGVELTEGTYYFNSEEPTVSEPFVAMNLSYNNFDFDDHTDLNFGIEYTSHIVIQEVTDELVRGFIDAHLKCNGCGIAPYLITARFKAIRE